MVGSTVAVVIYDGWGGSERETTICKLTEQLDEGRALLAGQLTWTHFIDVDFEIDIRDGCTRTSGLNGLSYADGDEVRIPDAQGTKYVVVFVTAMGMGTDRRYKRAYLMRDDPVFDGTGWT